MSLDLSAVEAAALALPRLIQRRGDVDAALDALEGAADERELRERAVAFVDAHGEVAAVGWMLGLDEDDAREAWTLVVPSTEAREVVEGWMERIVARRPVWRALAHVLPASFPDPREALTVEVAAAEGGEELAQALRVALDAQAFNTHDGWTELADRGPRHRRVRVAVATGGRRALPWAALESLFREEGNGPPWLRRGAHLLVVGKEEPEDLPPVFARGSWARVDSLAGWDASGWLERTRLVHTGALSTRNPYRGLEPFTAADARWLFGRDAELIDLRRRLASREGAWRWVSLEGGSGVGKSSVACAAVAPAIQWGLLDREPLRWRVAAMRPLGAPLRSLAEALTRALGRNDDEEKVHDLLRGDGDNSLRAWLAGALGGPGERLMLVVDQLEELVSLRADAAEVARFDRLLAAALSGPGPLHLLTTLRGEFVHSLDVLPGLRSLGEAVVRVTVSSPTGAALHAAIEEPARLAGALWEPGLAQRVARDARDHAAPLPLIEHVLTRLYEDDALEHARGSADSPRGTPPVLTHESYERLGGVTGALAASADAMIDALDERQRELARILLLALVRVGHGAWSGRGAMERSVWEQMSHWSEGVTRRLMGEAAPGEPKAPALVRVRQVLAETARPGGGSPQRAQPALREEVELANDAILTQWERLRRWIDASRHLLTQREVVEEHARVWQESGADPAELPKGGTLAYLQGAPKVWLSASARGYLDAALAKQERRLRWMRRWIAVSVAFLYCCGRELLSADWRSKYGLKVFAWALASASLISLCVSCALYWRAVRRRPRA